MLWTHGPDITCIVCYGPMVLGGLLQSLKLILSVIYARIPFELVNKPPKMADHGRFHHSWSLPVLYCCFYLSICLGKQHWHLCFPGTTINNPKLLREIPVWVLYCKHVMAMFCFFGSLQLSPFLYPLPVMYVRLVNIFLPHGHILYPSYIRYTYILLPHGYILYPSCIQGLQHLITTWTYPLPIMCGMHSFYHRIDVPSVHVNKADLCRPTTDSGMIG